MRTQILNTLGIILFIIIFIPPISGNIELVIIPDGSENETGTLEVNGTPGVLVAVDDVMKGIIPPSGNLIIPDVRSGNRLVSGSKEGFPSEKQLAAVYHNNSTTITMQPLIPYGGLKVESMPEGAEVYVNGLKFGNTPVEASQMELGIYNVTIQMRGYRDWEKSITINWNENVSIQADLNPLYPITPKETMKTSGFLFISTVIALLGCICFYRKGSE